MKVTEVKYNHGHSEKTFSDRVNKAADSTSRLRRYVINVLKRPYQCTPPFSVLNIQIDTRLNTVKHKLHTYRVILRKMLQAAHYAYAVHIDENGYGNDGIVSYLATWHDLDYKPEPTFHTTVISKESAEAAMKKAEEDYKIREKASTANKYKVASDNRSHQFKMINLSGFEGLTYSSPSSNKEKE